VVGYKYFVEVIGMQYYIRGILMQLDNDDTENANNQ
jgi:hypothetical protein